ncbi:MAG: hypothetical protein LQ350_001905 [Teloschistes chrysophthalmus]|nr:MAG: hypothetical protein LQ350_001905 [Niorma chrysophthalma]
MATTEQDTSQPGIPDPEVFVSENAPEATRKLWELHGHPYSDRYSDRSLNSIGALVKYAATTYKNRTAFLYPLSEKTDSYYALVTWEDFDRVTDTVASNYSEQLHDILSEANINGVQPTVGLLGRGTGVEFYITVVALQKLSIKTLMFFSALAPEIVQTLFDRCGALALIIDAEYAATPLSAARKISMIEDPFTLPTSKPTSSTLRFEDNRDPWDRHSIIIHSSGSTGVPKPKIHTNRSLLLMARMYRLLPNYHIQNWYLLFALQPITANIILPSGFAYGLPTVFPPRIFPPKPEAILTSLKAVAQLGYEVDCVHTTPQIIEAIFRYINSTGKDFSTLRNLKVLQPGSALLADHITKKLIDEGVNVKQTYGTSELGPLMRTYPHDRSNPRMETMRLVPLPGMDTHARMEPIGHDHYELVFHDGLPFAAELWGSGLGAQVARGEVFRTNDLFIRDEKMGEGSWILKGRRDDVLTLSPGDVMISALDTENAVKREGEGLIKAAMQVGHGKANTGLIVELESEKQGRLGAEEEVWEAARRANEGVVGEARVEREMVVVLEEGRELPVGVKGNVRREVAMGMFEGEVEALYKNKEGGSGT